MTASAHAPAERITASSGSTSGILLIAGGLLALAGNLLHPRFYEDDQVLVYRLVNLRGDRIVWADLLLTFAVLLVAAGLVHVGNDLAARGAPTLGDLGRTTAVIGGGLAVLQYAVDGYALRQAAHIFALADAHNRVGAFYATAAVDRINTAMFSAWTLLLLGVTPLLIVAAMWTTRTYPRWLTITGSAGALACLVTAVFNLAQEDQSTLTILFLVGSLSVTGWIIATGWLLTRRAHAAEQPLG